LLRQWLIEGAALAAGATAGGLLLAAGLMPAIRQLVPPSVPRADEIALDQALVWFAATVVAVVTALAALAPAWRASRVDVIAGLKRSATAVSADRSTTLWRRLLVGLQAGLAAALLAVAGLLLASFWRLTHVPLGFSADGVLAVELRVLDRQRYRHDDQLRRLQADLIDRVSAVPGVSAVAIASAVPFRGVDWTYNVDRLDGAGGSVSANARQVDAAYFAVMGISLRRGRLLQASDIAGAPSVAVVSEAFARDLFGDEDPIGREIGVIEPHRSRIVGVVGDVRYASLDSEPRRAVYLSRAQHPSELMCLLVRGFGVVPVSAVRRAVQEADPALPAMHAATIDEIASRTLSSRRFYTMTTALFAGLAVVLTLGGLVVIVARAVVERRKELAICAALGATGRRLQGKVVRGASLPVAVGLAFGLAAAYVSAPVLGTLLFEIDPRSAAVFAITAASIAGASATAAWIASRRATATAPSILLRE
jgi:predicted permease